MTPIRSEHRATVLAPVLTTFAAEAARMAGRREVPDDALAELASDGREDWMPLPAADISLTVATVTLTTKPVDCPASTRAHTGSSVSNYDERRTSFGQ